jgi:hypothetical protein
MSDYTKYRSWRLVGIQWGVTKPMAYRIAVNGYEPKDITIRNIFGLPIAATVISIDGLIQPGAQCPGTKQCACAQWFVPNTPRRIKCYTCSPRRTRKLSDNL